MRRALCAALWVLWALCAAAEQFRIAGVDYVLERTRAYALAEAVPVDTARTFGSAEECAAYLDDLRQRLVNTRAFSDVEVEAGYGGEPGADGVRPVRLTVRARDSRHLLALPYPKYDSNTGLSVKFKVKDTNFLGTMSTLDFEANYLSDTDEDTDDAEKGVSFGFSYKLPFPLGPVHASWNNDFSLLYAFGDAKPEFSAETGFTFRLPLRSCALVLDVAQGIARDFDYTEYGDELYGTSRARLSVPISIYTIGGWGDVIWAPYSQITVNYDRDGINKANLDLTSPVLEFGHELSTERIDWHGALRNGLSARLGQSIGYDFLAERYIIGMEGEVQAFKAFSRAGIATRLLGIAALNRTTKIGAHLRGIRDNQKLRWADDRALKVAGALVVNVDVPVRLFTTDWERAGAALFGGESWVARHIGWMRTFNFELQLSPFLDAALATNEQTGKHFALKDGWYSGGVEFLVYPQKWRSIVVRASCGVDLGKKLIKRISDSAYDTSWRLDDVSAYELYIGLGLHY